MKIALVNSPILIFPGPNVDYILYTYTSKHSWSGVLTQKKIVQINGEETNSFLPITYINPYHAEGYSQLASNYATRDYGCNQSTCSTMPSTTIVT